jgi:hypothetical protein
VFGLAKSAPKPPRWWKMEAECRNCAYWRRTDESIGLCTRPQIAPYGTKTKPFVTRQEQWCGECEFWPYDEDAKPRWVMAALVEGE